MLFIFFRGRLASCFSAFSALRVVLPVIFSKIRQQADLRRVEDMCEFLQKVGFLCLLSGHVVPCLGHTVSLF